MGMIEAIPEAAGFTAAICSRDRPEMLRRALTSLMALDPPADEILVIDNAPSDDRTFTLIRDEFPAVRYVCEHVAGLDFARNRALAESRHSILGFIDDDVIADSAWCGALRSAFDARPALGACTGRVEALIVETPAQLLFEANGGFSRGSEVILLPDDVRRPLHGRSASAIAWAVSIGCGASLAVRRTAALSIGGFDNALDLGAVLPGGGDLDMLWRLLDAGYQLQYQPSAMAWHEHRRDMPSIERQLAGHQRALLAFLAKSVTRARSGGRRQVSAFFFWRLAKPVVRLGLRMVGRDPLPLRLLFRMCWNCWIGAIGYGAARREAARRIAEAKPA